MERQGDPCESCGGTGKIEDGWRSEAEADRGDKLVDCAGCAGSGRKGQA